jgi:hypothetical protein
MEAAACWHQISTTLQLILTWSRVWRQVALPCSVSAFPTSIESSWCYCQAAANIWRKLSGKKGNTPFTYARRIQWLHIPVATGSSYGTARLCDSWTGRGIHYFHSPLLSLFQWTDAVSKITVSRSDGRRIRSLLHSAMPSAV